MTDIEEKKESLVSEGPEEDVDLQKPEEEPEIEDEGENPEPAEPDQSKDPSKEQSKEDNSKFAAARREAERQARELKERQDAFAQKYGFPTFEHMEAAQRRQEIEAQRERQREAGIDPDALDQAINNHPAVKKAAEVANMARLDSEFAQVKDKPFYKELEPDIKRTLAANPSLRVADVYNYIRGVKADELFKSAKSIAEKRAVANISDRKGRGLTDTTDNNLDDSYEMSNEGLEMARAFGNDPKKVAKRIKKRS